MNVITKSGTNSLHGSLFEYQRLQALSADTSNGMPLEGFRREQFGGSIGGAIVKNKLFFFAASEGINENLTRPNLSAVIGTPCSVTNPVFRGNITDAQIDASGDCQRQTLLNFYRTNFNQEEGLPVDRTINNVSVFGRVDYNVNSKNLMYGSIPSTGREIQTRPSTLLRMEIPRMGLKGLRRFRPSTITGLRQSRRRS